MATEGVAWIAHVADGTDAIIPAGSFDCVTAAVGPEGGWTEEEYAAAVSHGFQPVQLGKRVYRIETAATVIAAMLTS